MRYIIQSYRFHGMDRYRIIDTMNGGKVIAYAFVSEADAVLRRDELNKTHDTQAAKLTPRTPLLRLLTTLLDGEISTPVEARDFAAQIQRTCYSDEIIAHVALALLRLLTTPNDGKALRMRIEEARFSASRLVSAYDRQYQD